MRPLGAAVAGVLAIALLGFAGFYLYELAIGASDSPVRVIMSVVLFLMFALAAAAMSRGWLRGDSWPVTATLVAGALLLPTAWTLLQAEQFISGVLIAVVGVCGVYAGWKGRAAPD